MFMFVSLDPLIIVGSNWILGIFFVFFIAHIPAVYLAKWTLNQKYLPFRVILLALMFGANAFFLLSFFNYASYGWTMGLRC